MWPWIAVDAPSLNFDLGLLLGPIGLTVFLLYVYRDQRAQHKATDDAGAAREARLTSIIEDLVPTVRAMAASMEQQNARHRRDDGEP